MKPDDEGTAVWRSAREGNADDYARLRASRRELVWAVLKARARALRTPDLEDLEQEVWLAVWFSLPRFEGRSTFDTWLVGLAINVLRAWLRRKQVRENAQVRLSETDELIRDESDVGPLRRMAVSEEIERLPWREQEVIELRY